MKRQTRPSRLGDDDDLIVVDDATPGRASDYITQLSSLVAAAAKRGMTELHFVLYDRVSKGDQKDIVLFHLDELRKKIKRLCRKYKIRPIFVDMLKEIDVRGWHLTRQARFVLRQAAKTAIEHQAILATRHTSRFVRNKNHRDRLMPMMPTVEDFENLLKIVGKAQLATWLHPDVHEDPIEDTKLGKAKQANSHEPRKHGSHLTAVEISKILELHEQGWTKRAIARELEVDDKTVRNTLPE